MLKTLTSILFIFIGFQVNAGDQDSQNMSFDSQVSNDVLIGKVFGLELQSPPNQYTHKLASKLVLSEFYVFLPGNIYAHFVFPYGQSESTSGNYKLLNTVDSGAIRLIIDPLYDSSSDLFYHSKSKTLESFVGTMYKEKKLDPNPFLNPKRTYVSTKNHKIFFYKLGIVVYPANIELNKYAAVFSEHHVLNDKVFQKKDRESFIFSWMTDSRAMQFTYHLADDTLTDQKGEVYKRKPETP